MIKTEKEINTVIDGKECKATIKKVGFELKNSLQDMCSETTVDRGKEHLTIKYGKLKSLMVQHSLVPEKCVGFDTNIKTMDPEVGEWLAEEIGEYHAKKKPTPDSPSSTEPVTQS